MEREQAKETGPVLQGSCKPISNLPSRLNSAIPVLPPAAPAYIDLIYEMHSMYHLCTQSANHSLQSKSSLLSVFIKFCWHIAMPIHYVLTMACFQVQGQSCTFAMEIVWPQT